MDAKIISHTHGSKLITQQKSAYPHHYSTVTDCFGEGVFPKNITNHKVDFDLLEIIQDLKKKFQE